MPEAKRALGEANRLWPYDTARGHSPGDGSSAIFAAQVRSYQDGLRLAGARDHADEDAFRRLPIEALRGELTTAQLASKHGIHQTMVGEWKKQAMEGLAAVFSDRSAAQETAKSSEAEVEKLHAKIGQLLVERDFLAKASGR